MSGIRKKIAAFIAAVGHERAWTTVKFCILFLAVVAFVSYNFGGLIVGLPVAVAITALAVVHRRLFDAASDAFLDVNEDDAGSAKAKKTAAAAAKRLLLTILDYGLAGLSIAMVIAAQEYGFSYLAAVVAMWLVIDLPSAAIFITLYELTGRDMTLGRSYRRMAKAIFAQSRLAGTVVMLYEVTLSFFWSGPDYTVIFFKDELNTRMKVIVASIIITAIHAVLWTTVYWFGYENLSELANYLWTGLGA